MSPKKYRAATIETSSPVHKKTWVSAYPARKFRALQSDPPSMPSRERKCRSVKAFKSTFLEILLLCLSGLSQALLVHPLSVWLAKTECMVAQLDAGYNTVFLAISGAGHIATEACFSQIQRVKWLGLARRSAQVCATWETDIAEIADGQKRNQGASCLQLWTQYRPSQHHPGAG